MAICVVQREAVGRPGILLPRVYKRVWLCKVEHCQWWGVDGPKIHVGYGDKADVTKHQAHQTYETPTELVVNIYPHARDVPVITRRYQLGAPLPLPAYGIPDTRYNPHLPEDRQTRNRVPAHPRGLRSGPDSN